MSRPICRKLALGFAYRKAALLATLLLVLLAGIPIRAIAQTFLAQAATPENTSAMPSSNVELLPGKSIERQLAGDEVHTYQLSLQAGQYLDLVIEQRDIDVAVKLIAPDGTPLGEANASKAGDIERIWGTFQEPGIYRIEVRIADKTATGGRYEVKLKELREATQQDKDRLSANRLYGEGMALYERGTVDSKKQAIEKFEQLLPLYRSLGDKPAEAQIINLIGFIYSSLGDKQQALDYYKQSLPLFRAVGDRYGEGVISDNIGSIYAVLGEYQLAIDYHKQALSLFQAEGKRSSEAIALNQLGVVYKLLGEKQQALDYFSQALQIFRELNNREAIATSIDNIGSVYSDLGDEQKALDYYKEALPIWQALGNRRHEAINLNNIGFSYLILKDEQQALNYYKQALTLSESAGDKVTIATLLDNIGQAYARLGDNQQALDYHERALPLRQSMGDASGMALTRYNIAVVERNKGNLDRAKTEIEEALKIVENLRKKVSSSELRTSYFATVQNYYQFYIDLLMQLHEKTPSQGYDAMALQASESARARSLLEILAESGADIRSGAEPKLLEQERQLQRLLDDKEKSRIQILSGEHTPQQEAAINKEINELLDKYRELKTQIRATSPHYAALTQPQPLTLKEIQSTLLDDDTLLLEYALGEDRSYVWAVSKTGMTSYKLAKRADIEAAAKRFRTALTAPAQRENPKAIAPAAQSLSQLILEPVASALGKKRLLVVSDGALQYIPFAALSTPGNAEMPLIVEREIVNLPSASTLAILRRDTLGRNRAPKTIAVLADPIFGADDERVKGNARSQSDPISRALPPDAQKLQRAADAAGVQWNRLPFTRTEAEKILALVPESERSAAFDFTANRTLAISQQLSQYRIVHFATHGFANTENPELSGIVMSLVDEKGNPQNGFLRLNDIFNLNLPAELVVLSACQTGLGKQIKGEGLVGLTRGFMYAGAPRVVVSLWSVNDKATSELMVRFYKKMIEDKLAPAAALRAAQVEMLQQTEWKSPYFWAAFGLQGEWK